MPADDDLPAWLQRHRWDVGERIRTLRHQRGLSQLQLAERIGVDVKTISRAENGHYPISVDQLARIAYGLDVPSARLLPDDRPPGTAGR
ncbi:helix-turn-helix domain-containing protein [Kitasatospora mediocidica]|uniref:helix-turn-helix domain-containing protein n=1 Tax=Kitasatospora mediocidica TaxID=58352 RepID=UPI00068FCBF0|nr:helix-turn-helix transcriptional regulator [Kitasatospora mediocidica]